MHKNITTKKNKTFCLLKKGTFLYSLILLASCHNDYENETKVQALELRNNYEIVNGTIKIENKHSLKSILNSYKSDVSGQNNFNDEIRKIQGKGFKSLTPIFDVNDTKSIEDYIVAKKQKKQILNSQYGKSQNDLEDDSEDYEFDVEDDLIQDPGLAAILNEDREIIVGDSLYKFTEHGLYFCLENKKDKLYSYLDSLSVTSEIENLTNRFVTQVRGDISLFRPNRSSLIVSVPNMPRRNFFPELPTPKLIKSNLPVAGVSGNSFFEGIFGEMEVDTEKFDDGKRIKIKFWNQNYFLYSSLGCSARFQKKVRLFGITGWQKSYTDQIELGVNDISYDYNFNVPVYNEAKYNYENFFIEINGVKYAGSGKQILEFPGGSANFPFIGSSPQEITVRIFRKDLFEFNYDANKVYNQAIDLAVKQAFKKIVSFNPALAKVEKEVENGDRLYKVIAVNPLSNKVTISTQGLKWTSNNDNAIVHYFDLNFLFTYNSDYNNPEDYLKGLQGSKNYTNVRADIYGAALHNNEWKGRRLILGN
ncbi:hypothetical protein B4N84_13475 [Flavobacterium sp. IR1]|nr:hypothetical protein B4N84_13475 [Flavobacterium sp. IR1]